MDGIGKGADPNCFGDKWSDNEDRRDPQSGTSARFSLRADARRKTTGGRGQRAIDLAILGGWIALFLWSPKIGWIAALPLFAIAVVPDIVAYVAIHLRYDTMWYVITDRSLRARRGIWVLLEHTITFENVQNVYVRRGPIQQLFGISSVVLETAGAAEGESENPFAVGNKAIMEGIDNPEEIRQLIMERVRASRSAGLGDEPGSATRSWCSPQHVKLLQEIREEVRGIRCCAVPRPPSGESG